LANLSQNSHWQDCDYWFEFTQYTRQSQDQNSKEESIPLNQQLEYRRNIVILRNVCTHFHCSYVCICWHVESNITLSYSYVWRL